MIRQTEITECGIACIAMISCYWGHKIDLPNIRKYHLTSLKGTTLQHLISLAQQLNLMTRPLKLDLSHLHKLKAPSVLHWDMNHFVVLKKVSRDFIIIHDPAVGERKMPISVVSEHFTGVALEMTPSSEFKAKTEERGFTLFSLIGTIDRLGLHISQLLMLGIAIQICVLISPFYLQLVIDEVLVGADIDLMTVLGIGFLLLSLLQSAIGAVRSWATTIFTANINFQWLSNVFAHLLKLPFSWFEKRHLGDITSRFNSVQVIQRNLTTQFVESIIDGLLVLATLGVMFVYSSSLTIISLLFVVFYILLRCIIFRPLRESNAEQILYSSRQNTHLIESIRGLQSLRLFNRQDDRRARWINLLSEQFNSELNVSRLSLIFQTANTLLFSSEKIIIIWLAALAVMRADFSVGMLFAYISYKEQFIQRMISLVDKLFEIKMLRLHGERVADIVLEEPEIEIFDRMIVPSNLQPKIEIKNLYFRHSDSEPYIINNLSLIIPAGQYVAITGASGCGKTTLLKLITGLLEPTSGEILVGDISIRKVGLKNYREMLGTVMQDDYLFTGSISENITFFDPFPNMEFIEDCARNAAIHNEIVDMPMAYSTPIGDIGTGLSGGQKQRILLARALYKRPKIIVLDEATSHLDVENESKVNDSIQKIFMTRILVAHRPETISSAERVVVLQNGMIHNDEIKNLSSIVI